MFHARPKWAAAPSPSPTVPVSASSASSASGALTLPVSASGARTLPVSASGALTVPVSAVKLQRPAPQVGELPPLWIRAGVLEIRELGSTLPVGAGAARSIKLLVQCCSGCSSLSMPTKIKLTKK